VSCIGPEDLRALLHHRNSIAKIGYSSGFASFESSRLTVSFCVTECDAQETSGPAFHEKSAVKLRDF
jgi:hypothetical protein